MFKVSWAPAAERSLLRRGACAHKESAFAAADARSPLDADANTRPPPAPKTLTQKQENVLAESAAMVPETRQRLEAAAAQLQAALKQAEQDLKEGEPVPAEVTAAREALAALASSPSAANPSSANAAPQPVPVA